MTEKHKKEQQQRKWGLSVNSQIPLILVSEVDEHIQGILEQILDGIASIGIQLAVVSPGEEKRRHELLAWEQRYPAMIKIIDEKEANSDVFDLALMEEVTVERLKQLKDLRLVPLAEKGKVVAFDPIEEKGNGFVFTDGNPWSLFAALVRAAETYRFPYDWQNIVRAVEKTR